MGTNGKGRAYPLRGLISPRPSGFQQGLVLGVASPSTNLEGPLAGFYSHSIVLGGLELMS